MAESGTVESGCFRKCFQPLTNRSGYYTTNHRYGDRAVLTVSQSFGPTHHTYRGSKNWMTMTNPSVTKIIPRLSSSMRQHMPLMLGQNGLGAAMASTVTPPFLEVLVFMVLVTEGGEGPPPLRYEYWLGTPPVLDLEPRLREREIVRRHGPLRR